MVRIYLAEIKENTEDSERQNECRGSRHERESAAAHDLLFRALEKEFPDLAGSFCLKKDERGKPYLSGHEEIYISISHSGELAACAIGDRPVGVDVEERKSRSGQLRILRKFHDAERQWLENQDPENQPEAFYDLWVRKESFLKATGDGLRLRLDSFCTVDEEIRKGADLYTAAVCRVVQNVRPETYYILQYRMPGKNYSLAACSTEQSFENEPVWISQREEF